jgi:hypothetical protein
MPGAAEAFGERGRSRRLKASGEGRLLPFLSLVHSRFRSGVRTGRATAAGWAAATFSSGTAEGRRPRRTTRRRLCRTQLDRRTCGGGGRNGSGGEVQQRESEEGEMLHLVDGLR